MKIMKYKIDELGEKTRVVKGLVSKHFGIHKRLDGGYSVSHLISGRHVRTYKKLWKARLLVEKLESCAFSIRWYATKPEDATWLEFFEPNHTQVYCILHDLAKLTARPKAIRGGELESYVGSIPCLIGIDSFTHVSPWCGHPHECPSDADYHGYTEIEFSVYDRKGYKATWLEDKLTGLDKERIEQEIIDHKSAMAEDDRY